MEKAIILGSENKEINIDVFKEVLWEKADNISYDETSWNRIKEKIQKYNIDTIVGSKDNINVISKLLWECSTLRQYVLTDAEDAWQIEKMNEKRNRLRWDIVANSAKANDSIEQTGWVSSFTGKLFSEKEMDEYAENALYKVRDWCKNAAKVLEIGIASGLTCFKIAPLVSEYIGFDISKKTLEKTQSMLERKGIENVKLYGGGVYDLASFNIQGIDIVIINSVAQYFPGYNYFIEVLRKCVKCMAETGIIFVGDLLDLDQREKYLNALKEAGGKRGREDLWYPKNFIEEVPAYIPEISNVTISSKEKYTIINELVLFRYDAVYTVNQSKKSNCKKTKFQYNKDFM